MREAMVLRACGLMLALLASLASIDAQAPQSAVCYKHVSNRVGGCPATCPSLSTCDVAGTSMCVEQELCHVVIPGGESLNVSGSLQCRTCDVFGCDRCEVEGVCRPDSCGGHFTYLAAAEAKDSSCEWNEGYIWKWSIIVFVLVLVWVAVDFVRAWCAETTNVEALDAGIQARWRGKMRKTWEDGNPQFSFFGTTLHWHEEGVAPIGGPGIPIFMNCVTLVGVIGTWLSVITWVLGPGQNPAALSPCSNEADIIEAVIFDKVNSSVLHNRIVLVEVEEAFFPHWAFYNYVGAVVISLVYAIVQAKLWQRLEMFSIAQHRYCVEANGFPPSACDKAELLTFLQDELQDCMLPADGIEYVSIAYDYDAETKQRVDTSVRKHLKQTKKHLDLQEGFANPAAHECCEHCDHPRDQPGHSQSCCNSDEDEDREASSDAGPFWIRVLGYLMAGIDFSVGNHGQCFEEGIDSEELDKLPNSGVVYVVMKSEVLALGFASMGEIIYEDEDGEAHPISLKVCTDEPSAINWHQFDTEARASRPTRCFFSALILLVGLVVWFILYLPFAFMLISTSGYESNFKFVLESSLGVFIAIGNCFICAVVQQIVDYIGFTSEANQDVVKLVLIIPCNLVNCITDFFLVTYVVWRVTETEDATFADFTAEWFALLFPSYVFLPYLAEPLMAIFLPFFVSVLRIKRDRTITPEMAEEVMLAPDMDIINPAYNDIIGTSAILFFSFVFAPSYGHRFLFPLLIVQCGVIYIQSRLKILRWLSQTSFNSITLHNCESMYWALPLGFLATAYERQYFEVTGHISSLWTAHSGWMFFSLHVLVHFIFLHFVLPQLTRQRVSRSLTYRDAMGGDEIAGNSMLSTYLNTNPIEVLKSHVCREDGRAVRELSTGEYLVYYRKDLRHVQPGAHRSWNHDLDNGKGWKLKAGFTSLVSEAKKDLKGAAQEVKGLLDTKEIDERTLVLSARDASSSNPHAPLLAPDGLPFRPSCDP